MPELSRNPDDYDGHDAYAHAQAINAKHDRDPDRYAIGGTAPDETLTETLYAVETHRGGPACSVTDDLAGVIEDIVDYRDGARLVTRQVTYGPWRYVTPEEIENA